VQHAFECLGILFEYFGRKGRRPLFRRGGEQFERRKLVTPTRGAAFFWSRGCAWHAVFRFPFLGPVEVGVVRAQQRLTPGRPRGQVIFAATEHFLQQGAEGAAPAAEQARPEGEETMGQRPERYDGLSRQAVAILVGLVAIVWIRRETEPGRDRKRNGCKQSEH